jgi:hypothetical protein
MLWNTRLDYPTWQNYSRILTEFGGLNGAKHKILATGDTNLKAAAYIKNNTILIMVANTTDIESAISLNKLRNPDNLPLTHISDLTNAEDASSPLKNIEKITIPAKNYILLTTTKH